MREWWEGDERGSGVASAAAGIGEDPESHLLRALEAVCVQRGGGGSRAPRSVVTTEMLGDSCFAPHGHVVRVRVRAA